MSNAYDVLLSRRSIKKFKPDMISDDLIEKILNAGLNAPSARNHQGTIFIVLTNKEFRAKLSKLNAIIGERGGDPFYGAPVIIIALGDKAWPYHVQDGSLAIGNMLNAAHTLGLGGCWINRAKEEFELPEYQQVLKDLGIKGEYTGIGHCAIGYPDTKPLPHDIHPNRVYRLS